MASALDASGAADLVDVVLTSEDIPGSVLPEPLERHTIPKLKWWLQCREISVLSSWKKGAIIKK